MPAGIPRLGRTFLASYVPVWLALLVFVGRYSLQPLWKRRPIYLRGFATEEDELGLKHGRLPPSTGTNARQDRHSGVQAGDTDTDVEATASGSAVEIAVDEPAEGAVESDSDNATDSSASSTIVGFGRRNSVVDSRPVSIGGGLATLVVRSWHLMAITLFLLSVAGVATSLILTFAAGHGRLYLTPVVPCFISAILLAIDRPRSLPSSVLFIYTSTLFVQIALLFGVPGLSEWPLNLTWLAEMSVTSLSIGIMMAMPMRDPRLGLGRGDDRIAGIFETPSIKSRSPEDNLNMYQWMTVNWMAPVISLGATRQLQDEDVWHLPFEFQHARLYRLFHDVKGSVTARIIKVNTPDLIITSLLGILDSMLSMLPIILLKLLLASMEGPQASVRVASVYAVFICITNIARAQAGVFSLWFTRRCYERSRGELITMIYEKTLRRKAFTFPGRSGGARGPGGGGGMTEIANSVASGSAPASTGKILNLMRNDVYEVAQRFWEFPTLFTKPLNFVLSIFLLWNVLGAASLLGILVIVAAQIINVYVVKVLVHWELARRAVTDTKLQVTSQFIESIRHLRWYDWQDKWLANILTARQKELNYRVITNLIQKAISIINQLAASFFPVAAFYAYTVIEKRPLTIDIAFPALNLFNLLEQSLRELPDLITVMLNANVAIRRIEAFMAEPDKEGIDDEPGRDVLTQAPEGALVDGIIRPPGPLYIGMEDAAFAWPTAETAILTKVNFVADGPGLTVICGKVGTGKTALLMTLLGEMDQHAGTRSVPKETIGYSAQTPWLQSMTVRENILFCHPYDETRYNRVIEACCLLPDFAEFEAGDMSNVGENGIGLSGGQKARVALARAIYSRARILLLDDPIAALDHNTAESIMKRLFATSGLMKNRLVIFVTHRMDLAADYADQIYEVSDEHGIVSKIDADHVRRTLNASAATSTLVTVADESEAGSSADNDSASSSSESEAENAKPHEDKVAKNKFIEEEHRVHGGVMLSVYWRYIKAGGAHWWALVIVCFVGFRISKIAYFYFLKIWGEAYGSDAVTTVLKRSLSSILSPSMQVVVGGAQGDDDMLSVAVHHGTMNSTGWTDKNFGLPNPESDVLPWLFWFTVLALSSLVFRTLGDLILIAITYTAGKQVFQQVMVRVSTAPFRFFDVTPVGRLMNRVTSDIGTIDGAIAQQIHRCAWFALNWVSSILVIASATPTFLVMAVFMTSAFVLIFFHFLPASQSLRRLEMVSLSPLMSNFGTLLEGLTTVRAFRVQPHFQERIIATTDAFQRMDHFYWSLQAWLQWRFNALTALSTFALTMTALGTGLSSGLVAFVLTSAAYFVNSTQVLCRRYGELQMQFVSVERVTELLDLDQEPVGDVDPPAAWPTTNDDIVFDNASFRYAPHLEPSLREINMRIPAGSTVAVTGRTGSGKSTLALALLGTILPDNNETSQGSIYIGSMNVATVNKHKLRQRISFVAQDPVLFPGSLRENLDPVGEHTDEECELVLRRVLADAASDFTLSSRVDGGGKNMSQGQRQLIGLGRAVLRRSPIVILDEATASIDKKTAFQIQEVLREELQHSTVITIAHRVEAVRDADFSVVLENGRVIHAAPVEPGSTPIGSDHGP
ncbi:hypothetical protein HMPREF1624_06603 [Sporothrix schenckii ATCC 58251]|uniref:ABC transporter n=1 Tax=Sporothrix schenckii (strain ATCC 58251 / de Perez 2211183) TaxID=1391915 RepID=U7PNV0_SPOS1|nr:hypothetical protein HMPREF1624_06603 [Sporothrix schenckii ATCC 58251]